MHGNAMANSAALVS